MLDLFNNAKHHIPREKIPKENCMFLGYADCRDFVLAIEEWEFRIYSYEYWSWDSITDGEHENEDWWANIETYFWEWDGCFDMATCEYVVPNFQSHNILDMASDLYLSCEDRLEDISYIIDDEWIPSDALLKFLKRGQEKIREFNDTLVYCYYK